MWQLQCIATWGRPTSRQLLITRDLYQVWSTSTYPFLTYSFFTGHTLCYAVTLTSDSLILNVCIMYRLWRDQTQFVLNFSEIEQSAAELLML